MLAFLILVATGYAAGVRECMTFGGEAPTVPLFMIIFYWWASALFLVIAGLAGGFVKWTLRAAAGVFAAVLVLGIVVAVLTTTPMGQCTPI